jgi:Skp family chaperone for outer membrane proteins
VKRIVILSVGLVALLGVGFYVGTLGAQQGGAPAARPAPTTRIALLNLSHVIKNYDKYKAFQEELKTVVQPFEKRQAETKTEGDNLAKEKNNPNTAQAKKDQIDQRLKELQRILEDNQQEVQKVLIKKQEEQLKILYMDVRAIAERHAQGHNFEMVLHYNDHVKPEDYWSAANIARKMQAGALMPMYYVGGLDISQDVINTLNATYKAAPRPAAAAPGAGAPATGNPGAAGTK